MKILLIIIWFFLFLQNTFATEIDYKLDLESEISKEIPLQTSSNIDYKIDLSKLEEKLKILYPWEYIFNFDLIWIKSITWTIFERKFKDIWEKKIKLKITHKYIQEKLIPIETLSGSTDSWSINNEESNSWFIIKEENIEKIIFEKEYTIFIYNKSIPLIYSRDLKEEQEFKNYINIAKQDWIFIYEIWPLTKTDIELTSILWLLKEYEKTKWLNWDYIIIWWWKDFIFDILSKINREIQAQENKLSYNIVSISNYNLDILSNLLNNFLANKKWIWKMILLNESAKYIILKKIQINELINELRENSHIFKDINANQNSISEFMFMSKFINNLSNLWYSTNNIYIFLVIPIIMTFIIFFKHFIWLSPIWIVVPLFLSLIFFKLGFLISILFLIWYIILNLFLSIIINKFNMLYSPKIVFLMSINILFFIWFINMLYFYELISLDISDILYFIIFVIISEKLIVILTSKEITEYIKPFISTITIAIFSFLILNINAIKTFILAYPETIIFLVLINFLIWKYSWLRVTEYFRFKEIIKSVEE